VARGETMLTIKTQTPNANRTTTLNLVDALPFVLCDIIADWQATPIKAECTFTFLSLEAQDNPSKKAQITAETEEIMCLISIVSCYIALSSDSEIMAEVAIRWPDKRQQRIWLMQSAVSLWIIQEHNDRTLVRLLARLPLLVRYRWAANTELAKTMDIPSCIALFSELPAQKETK
jgi:hypothetical protein